jgi:maltooligosyltrehalose trehalohydrolase
VGAAVSEGRRREFAAFGWKPEDVPDPQDRTTFLRSKLDWSEAEGNPMLDWHRQLIALRKKRTELTDGRMDRVEVEFSDDWLTMRRGGVMCLCNLGAPRAFALPFTADMRITSNCTIQGRSVLMRTDSIAIVARGAE